MSEYLRIKALPREISDKIAAGEVVERPLSIVKELIENAIDADAKAIVVEIKNGGKTYLRITDDGVGIHKDDVFLAFARYATSKISKEEDLDAIHTLGFRGEALSSIAAVSRVELITKLAGENVGSQTVLEAGILQVSSDIACEQGTTIIVSDLFYNTPARKKFLKPDNTESALIIDYLSKITLAYPHIKIRLINNGTILFSTQGNGDVHRNVLTVYSKQIEEGLIAVKGQAENQRISLTGYIGKPNYSKGNRKFQIFFVNGRWINSKLIESAVSEAYADKLFSGRYPISFLFLRVDPEKLDVNIHPNKMDVRFFEELAVKNLIYDSIRKSLLQEDAAPSVNNLNIFKSKENIKDVYGDPGNQVDIKTISLTSKEERYEQALTSRSDETFSHAPELNENRHNYKPERRFTFSELNILGSLFATYILASNEEAMYIIDQHAAHERILFEQLLSSFKNERGDGQIILAPFLIELPSYIKEGANEKTILLEKIGYRVEPFGTKEYIVKEIPSCMDLTQAEFFVNEIFETPFEEVNSLSEKQVNSLISDACKAAVKANDLLTNEEIVELFFELDKTENPFSCPHGRPTFIKLSEIELERLFKRK